MNYNWKFSDYPKIIEPARTVFSCFAGGGGSTMGYKLAGFKVLGCLEIDPQMAAIYKINHKPELCYIESIQTFKNRNDIDPRLYNLDILDGSPPCSTFSLAGSREKSWGKSRVFREGQAKQILSNLFFDYIDLVKKLQPKIVVSENVAGLIIGKAKAYACDIYKEFTKIGYNTQLFLLDASTMGVPQARKRVFFISTRLDLNLPKLQLNFNKPKIKFSEICDFTDTSNELSNLYKYYWETASQGRSIGKFKSVKKLHMQKVAPTICATKSLYHPIYRRKLNQLEIMRASSFPHDYNYLDSDFNYVCGMSVPPLMMYEVAHKLMDIL